MIVPVTHYDNPMNDSETHNLVRRVVSGGQSGVDRGALDAAIALGIQHGGWCPRGRLAEDGPIPDSYQLQETDSSEYPVRTELNVRDSDGTLILYRNSVTGGTALTARFAKQYRKPLFLADLVTVPNVRDVARWLRDNRIAVLNVAGPRESTSPSIAEQTRCFLVTLLKNRPA